jgi:hypothetical protein
MLGETRESEDARERRHERTRLMHLAFPPSLIRFRRDVAQRQLDRLLDGDEPRVNPWNPYNSWQRAAYWLWRALLGLQRQRRRLAT